MGGGRQDGASIVASSNAASTAQHWRLVSTDEVCYYLVNVGSGKVLDNPGGSSTNGRQMQQWRAYADDPTQIWCFQSVGVNGYSVRNVASGFLLDLRDGSAANGTPVQQWSADPARPNANQTWRLLLI